MSFNFQQVTPKAGGTIDTNSIKLSNTMLSLSDDVLPEVKGGDKVSVGSDLNNLAIRLQADPAGYTVQKQDRKDKVTKRYLAMAKKLRKLGFPVGTYTQVEDGIFVYKEKHNV